MGHHNQYSPKDEDATENGSVRVSILSVLNALKKTFSPCCIRKVEMEHQYISTYVFWAEQFGHFPHWTITKGANCFLRDFLRKASTTNFYHLLPHWIVTMCLSHPPLNFHQKQQTQDFSISLECYFDAAQDWLYLRTQIGTVIPSKLIIKEDHVGDDTKDPSSVTNEYYALDFCLYDPNVFSMRRFDLTHLSQFLTHLSPCNDGLTHLSQLLTNLSQCWDGSTQCWDRWVKPSQSWDRWVKIWDR